jgi:hypothetical protein
MPIFPHLDPVIVAQMPPWMRWSVIACMLMYAALMLAGAYNLWRKSR